MYANSARFAAFWWMWSCPPIAICSTLSPALFHPIVHPKPDRLIQPQSSSLVSIWNQSPNPAYYQPTIHPLISSPNIVIMVMMYKRQNARGQNQSTGNRQSREERTPFGAHNKWRSYPLEDRTNSTTPPPKDKQLNGIRASLPNSCRNNIFNQTLSNTKFIVNDRQEKGAISEQWEGKMQGCSRHLRG